MMFSLFAALLTGFQQAYTEDGIVETTQVLVLLLSAACFAAMAIKAHGVVRIIFSSTVYVCLFLCLKEYEPLPTQGTFAAYIASRPARWHLTGLYAVLLGFWLVRGGWRWIIPLARYGLSWRLWPFLVAAGWVIIADLLEKVGQQWGEESGELLAYCTLAMAAYLYHARVFPATDSVCETAGACAPL